MSYSSCKSILPPFLWDGIVEYLSMDNILAIADIFGDAITSKAWKNCFLHKRQESIAIIRCKSKRMDHFWKYACNDYIIADNINDIIDIIIADNRLSSKHSKIKYIYYKIFIKGGKYTIKHKIVTNHLFNYMTCSVEIIGNNNLYKTVLEIDASKYKYSYKSIGCSHNFAMKYIVLNGFEFRISNEYVYDDFPLPVSINISNCVFNDSILSISSPDNVIITNCVFNDSILSISSPDNVIITNCTFNMSSIRTNVQFKLQVNYTISNNIFTNNDKCINMYGEIDPSSEINIDDNKVMNSMQLCNINDFVADITFRRNSISNVKCIFTITGNSHCNIMFEHNIFQNIAKLYNKENVDHFVVSLDRSNRFKNCGEGLTRYIT